MNEIQVLTNKKNFLIFYALKKDQIFFWYLFYRKFDRKNQRKDAIFRFLKPAVGIEKKRKLGLIDPRVLFGIAGKREIKLKNI